MQILLCQYAIENLNPERNRERVRGLLGGVGIRPPTLILLPELFSLGGLPGNFGTITAETVRRGDHDFLAELSSETGSHVIGASVGCRGNKLVNESLLFDPAGLLRGSFQKIHPFSLGGEEAIFASGTGAVTWDLGGFVIQPALCYDLRFPEMFRSSLGRGVSLITVQANWPESRQAHWETLLRARAIENQCFVAGVNCLGQQRGTRYAGGSQLINPKGETVASAGSAEGVFESMADPESVRSWRQTFPALADRKPQQFWY